MWKARMYFSTDFLTAQNDKRSNLVSRLMIKVFNLLVATHSRSNTVYKYTNVF